MGRTTAVLCEKPTNFTFGIWIFVLVVVDSVYSGSCDVIMGDVRRVTPKHAHTVIICKAMVKYG